MTGTRTASLAIVLMGLAAPVDAGEAGPARLAGPGPRPLAYTPLPLGRIKPAGWLKTQLRIQAEGLSGHLDEFWPDVKESAWIGGKAEGWERTPYWLDGLVPLAYELDDPRLIAKVRKYLDFILDHPHAGGWLGPVGDSQGHEKYDPWPLFVLFKALTQFEEATGDPRVIPAMTKCLHAIDEVITRTPLTSWAQFRAADLTISILWLHDRTREPWLLGLAAKVQGQAFDWKKLYGPDYPFRGLGPAKLGMENHGVNTGMALKFSGVNSRLTGDPDDRDDALRMLTMLDRFHGQATGIFTCDEHLAGRSPAHGTELCTVVETLYSLEELLSIGGNPALGDRLERITFNALPATFSPDMCAHQYDQQANQVVCKVAPDHVYLSNGPDANLFGLEPHFGCCTANMHQGWPKFASHLAMTTPDGGLAFVAYAPCEVATEVAGTRVAVEVRTDYPFRDTITIALDVRGKARFPLLLRIPGWAQEPEVTVGDDRAQAVAGAFHRIDREWSGRTAVTLRLPMEVKLDAGYNDSVTIERGPLVYALRVGAEWKRLKGNPPFADWEVFPTTPWNYAVRVDREHPERSIRFEGRPVGDRPFSPEGAPVVAQVRGKVVPGWGLEHHAAAPPPPSPVDGEGPMQDLTLVPYGSTSLRITEFPILKAEGAR